MELQLTAEERELLHEILQERHKNLIHEISRTDHHEFRHQLQERCRMLEGVMRKVQANEHLAA